MPFSSRKTVSQSSARDPDSPVVLVVDDDEATLNVVADVLHDAGYKVITAASGRDALEYLHSSPPPDLALVDLMMPGMDGWSFIGAFRREAHLARTPVVVMSAGGERTLSRAPVALAYLAKPLALESLVDTVSRFARRDRSPSSRAAFEGLEGRRHISSRRLRIPMVLAVDPPPDYVETNRETVACGGAILTECALEDAVDRANGGEAVALVAFDPAAADALVARVPDEVRVLDVSVMTQYQLEAAVRAAVQRAGF